MARRADVEPSKVFSRGQCGRLLFVPQLVGPFFPVAMTAASVSASASPLSSRHPRV